MSTSRVTLALAALSAPGLILGACVTDGPSAVYAEDATAPDDAATNTDVPSSYDDSSNDAAHNCHLEFNFDSSNPFDGWLVTKTNGNVLADTLAPRSFPVSLKSTTNHITGANSEATIQRSICDGAIPTRITITLDLDVMLRQSYGTPAQFVGLIGVGGSSVFLQDNDQDGIVLAYPKEADGGLAYGAIRFTAAEFPRGQWHSLRMVMEREGDILKPTLTLNGNVRAGTPVPLARSLDKSFTLRVGVTASAPGTQQSGDHDVRFDNIVVDATY